MTDDLNSDNNQEWKSIPLKNLSEEEQKDVNEYNKRMDDIQKRVNESSKEEFIKYFNIFPKGNPQTAWTKLQYHVAAEKDFFGNVLTYKIIYQKWTDYINQCNSENRAERFIKSFEKFIEDKDYNCQFGIKSSGKSSWLDKLK